MSGTTGLRRIVVTARNALRDQGLYEPALGAWAAGKAQGRAVRGTDAETIRAYLEQNDDPRLQVGEAFEIARPGWLVGAPNPHDRSRVSLRPGHPLPAPEGSFAVVLIEHALEHHGHPQGQLLLAEAFRLLQPGGVLRLSTVDLRFVLSILSRPDDPCVRRFVDWCVDEYLPDAGEPRDVHLVNSLFRDYNHRFLYTEETLCLDLEQAGFVEITRLTADTSARDDLCGLHHGLMVPADLIETEAIFLEATKR